MKLSVLLVVVLFINLLSIFNPMMMLLNILAISLLLAWSIGSLISKWLGFMVFLIYVGGMLVMFAYFVALMPNYMLMMSSGSLVLSVPVFNGLLLAWLYKSYSVNFIYQSETLLYMDNYVYLVLFLMLVLLIMMLLVVKLIYVSKGPLRPFNYV